MAANIRKIRKPEPYKGKGVRYAGERVQRKAGKAAQVDDVTSQRKKKQAAAAAPAPPGPQEGRGARPSGPAWPCSARTSTSSPRSSTTVAGRTLAAASTLEADLAAPAPPATRTPPPTVGRLVAERAKAAGVTKVVFDRGGFLYHGRVAAVADAAREAGLEF